MPITIVMVRLRIGRPEMKEPLSDRVAMITGATRGIGEATLQEEVWRVNIICTSEKNKQRII